MEEIFKRSYSCLRIPRDPVRETIRSKIIGALKPDKFEVTLPSLSASARLLEGVLQKEDVSLKTVGEVIKLDPALASKYLGVARSVRPDAKSSTNLQEALSKVGINRIRVLADAIGVVERVQHLMVQVDWDEFRLHSILTARITERIASAYSSISGKEYLAGLLHDVGKPYLEHYFPREFETVVMQAAERRCGMYEVEEVQLGITHAEISSLLCERWGLHRDIVRAVRFHHEPDSPFNKDPVNHENEKLLGTCICVADSLTNMLKANIQGARDLTGVDFESRPEWQFLQRFTPVRDLDLDLFNELEKALEGMAGILPKEEGAHEPAAGPSSEKKKVLLVDDDELVRNYTCDVLKDSNFDAVAVATCGDALDSLRTQVADALLLDIGLTGESGLDFLLVFKQLHPKVPVVMFTGLGHDESVKREAFKRGASAYVSKSAELEDVIGAVKRVTA